jgi:flagellar FliJ protein
MNGAAYKFRLERVRALRERHEDQAKQDFALALQVRQSAREQESRAQGRIIEARRSQLTAAGQGRFAAQELFSHQIYLERMEQAHRTAVEDVTRQEVKLEQRRVALTKASQDREALERLKQKGREEHTREAARVEQNVLDEIAGNGHWRRAA